MGDFESEPMVRHTDEKVLSGAERMLGYRKVRGRGAHQQVAGMRGCAPD